jgi:hypothetical protein
VDSGLQVDSGLGSPGSGFGTPGVDSGFGTLGVNSGLQVLDSGLQGLAIQESGL